MDATSVAWFMAVLAVVFRVTRAITEASWRSISRGLGPSKRWLAVVAHIIPGTFVGLWFLEGTAGIPRVLGFLGATGFGAAGLLVLLRSCARNPSADSDEIS